MALDDLLMAMGSTKLQWHKDVKKEDDKSTGSTPSAELQMMEFVFRLGQSSQSSSSTPGQPVTPVFPGAPTRPAVQPLPLEVPSLSK